MNTEPGPPAYFLRTERIGFRTWSAEDVPLAVGIWGDPEVTRLIADLGLPSEGQARERLAREMANLSAHGVQYWPIFLLDGGANLGCCGLRPYRPEGGMFEVGAHILPARWGRGYATEALRCVIAQAFGPLKARGLFARHNPNNHGSGRVLGNLGFRYTHDEFVPQTGLHHPCYLMATGSAYPTSPRSTPPDPGAAESVGGRSVPGLSENR
jgi:RimJ/RimL family protein N-acetyltransferase